MNVFKTLLFLVILVSCQIQTDKENHKSQEFKNVVVSETFNLKKKEKLKQKLIKQYELQRDSLKEKLKIRSSLSKLSFKQLYDLIYPLPTYYKGKIIKEEYKGFDFKTFKPLRKANHPIIDNYYIYKSPSGEIKEIHIHIGDVSLILIMHINNDYFTIMNLVSDFSSHTVLLYDKERELYFHLDILQAFRRKYYKKGEAPYELKTLSLLDDGLYPICKLTFNYKKLAINTDIVYNGLSKKHEIMKKVKDFTSQENLLFGDLEKLMFAEETNNLLLVFDDVKNIDFPMWIMDMDFQYKNDPRYVEEEEGG